MEEKYLTEEKLGSILKEVFVDFEIFPQFKTHNRVVDYRLKFNNFNKLKKEGYKNITLPIQILNELESRLNSFDYYYCMEYKGRKLTPKFLEKKYKEEIKDFFDDLEILIEYDGHYHYLSNSSVVKSIHGCEWIENDLIFELRIPYWVQLSNEISLMFFGIGKDFSNKFPQGFISKHCVLPERFCSAGEARFLKELELLPQDIKTDVIKSLVNKSMKKGIITDIYLSKTCSLILWRNLINLLPETNNFFKKIEEKGSEKFYKKLKIMEYALLESSAILKSLFFNQYFTQNNSDTFAENVLNFIKHRETDESILTTPKKLIGEIIFNINKMDDFIFDVK